MQVVVRGKGDGRLFDRPSAPFIQRTHQFPRRRLYSCIVQEPSPFTIWGSSPVTRSAGIADR